MPNSTETEIALTKQLVEQLVDRVEKLEDELTAEKERSSKKWQEIDRLTGFARMLFILSATIGAIISWFAGISDHVRKWLHQ